MKNGRGRGYIQLHYRQFLVALVFLLICHPYFHEMIGPHGVGVWSHSRANVPNPDFELAYYIHA